MAVPYFQAADIRLAFLCRGSLVLFMKEKVALLVNVPRNNLQRAGSSYRGHRLSICRMHESDNKKMTFRASPKRRRLRAVIVISGTKNN